MNDRTVTILTTKGQIMFGGNDERRGRKRRWRGYVLVGALTIAAGVVAVKLPGAIRQAEVVAEIEEAGGYVVYDYQVEWYNPDWSGFEVKTPYDWTPWDPLNWLFGRDIFHNVQIVHWGKSTLDYRDLRQLQSLPELKVLDLYCDVTDEDLRRIKRGLPDSRVSVREEF